MSAVILIFSLALFMSVLVAGVWYINNNLLTQTTVGSTANGAGSTTTSLRGSSAPGTGSGTGDWQNYQGDLIFKRAPFVFTLGAGGALYQITGSSGQKFYGPDLFNTYHDRLLQAVSWGVGTVADAKVGIQEDYNLRHNVNQCGGFKGGFAAQFAVYSGILDVDLLPNSNAVQVWCRATDQYQYKLADYFKSIVPMLTRYTPYTSGLPDGTVVMLCERFILYGKFWREGQLMSGLQDLYLENWTSHRNTAFDYVAWGGLSPTGEPRNAVSKLNLPDYQGTSASQTAGHVVSYKEPNGDCLGYIFHRGRYNVLNGRSYPKEGLFAILPASDIGGAIPSGTIVTQTLGIAVAKNLQDMAKACNLGQTLLKETKVYTPGAAKVDGLSDAELKRLRDIVDSPAEGKKTYKLGEFLKN